MSQADFDRAMPHEFWREVVDRVAAEVPGTLLLAEAFWLMEGYFVRTLGMHRVYNSAFMIMLRDEDNAKYRSVIKNTLEFDPDIMKRYVNFMSNPDERTAIDQFGKGDKYFGVAVDDVHAARACPCSATARSRDSPKSTAWSIAGRAMRRIPITGWLSGTTARLRRCSSGAGCLPRAATSCSTISSRANGSVNENVFAYSNRNGGERALVVYNNRYGRRARHDRFLCALRRQGIGSARSGAWPKGWASAATAAR